MAWSAPTTLVTGGDKVSVTSKVLTVSVGAAIGATVVVFGCLFSGGNGLTGMSIADSAGNTWALNNVNTTGRQDFIATSVLTNAMIGGSSTITITRTGTTNITVYSAGAVYFTGGLASSYEDAGMRANSSGASFAPTVTSGAGSVAGDLVFGLVNDVWATSQGFTEAAGWTTALSSNTTPAPGLFTNLAYLVNAGTTAQTYAPTLSTGTAGSHSWKAMIAGFFVSGAAPPAANSNNFQLMKVG